MSGWVKWKKDGSVFWRPGSGYEGVEFKLELQGGNGIGYISNISLAFTSM
jgi:hypothetical protein